MLTIEQVAAWAKRNTLGRVGRQVLHGDLVVTGGLYTAKGTWTPAITAATPGTLSVTYTTQTGMYRKLGDVCYFSFYILTNAVTLGTASGALRITGFPYTCSSNAPGACFTPYLNGPDVPSTSTLTGLIGFINPGWNYAQYYVVYDNAASAAVDISGLAGGDTLRGTGFYLTA